MTTLAEGSRSLGFNMKVFPQASATGNIHSGTIAGKLKGVIPATTPRGWRVDQESTPVPTSSVNSPFSNCGMPAANQPLQIRAALLRGRRKRPCRVRM
jgi:hypothetical protein